MNRLSAENLALAYDNTLIINALNLTIPTGKITALVGPNGCGKSTLLRGLARLLAPKRGHVYLDGKAIHRMPTKDLAKQIGILPQSPVAQEGLTVRELVAQGRYPHQSWFQQWSKSDDLLTQIAPTVAQPGDYVDYGIPWQELTLTVGKAVGQVAEAEAFVADVEAQFAQVQVDHPEFTGATSVVATPYQGIWVYGEQDVRGRFLTMLGFQLPAGLQEVTGTAFGGNLSMERADLLDVDVIIWLDAEEAEGELGGPVYQNLPVHTEGREVHLSSYNDPLGGATSFVSVLSLPFLLEGLVPQLVAAMGK